MIKGLRKYDLYRKIEQPNSAQKRFRLYNFAEIRTTKTGNAHSIDPLKFGRQVK